MRRLRSQMSTMMSLKSNITVTQSTLMEAIAVSMHPIMLPLTTHMVIDHTMEVLTVMRDHMVMETMTLSTSHMSLNKERPTSRRNSAVLRTPTPT